MPKTKYFYFASNGYPAVWRVNKETNVISFRTKGSGWRESMTNLSNFHGEERLTWTAAKKNLTN